ncbi:unannotated protein [freshwater metagenome]|uniref:Unannotated protein n=1 Tax=freshwater metagenome TaxID=449393 RepID=A0A6J7IQE9_9ZZZZ|nr:hypothetical protein [Actinomycetota bacterium]
MSTTQKLAITGPGLKKQGVVILQSACIGLFTFIEMSLRSGVGIITGVVILACFFGGIRFGRPGTSYVAVVTPPIAFAASALIFTILLDGLRPSRIGIDVVASLASEAPFLIIGAIYGWFIVLNAKAKNRPSKARR